MKAYMDNIAANTSVRKRICEDILDGRFLHAYIIEGRPGTGRHLLARTIASALVCENKTTDGMPLPCHTCNSCMKIEKDISPDVITIKKEPDKATIGVNSARFIRGDICVYPNDFDYKIYIIDEADIMTTEAQNALLLTLEEPPPYAVFLLICEKADSLLETVRSRAPILRTESIPPDIMSEYLCYYAPEKYSSEAKKIKNSSENEFFEIISSSDGAIGKAYELLDVEKRAPLMEFRQQVRSLIKNILTSDSNSDVFDSLSALSSKRDELFKQLETVTVAIRDLIVLKKYENAPLCFYTDREDAIELSSLKSATFLFKLTDAFDEAMTALEKNANIKLTVAALSAKISNK